MPRVSVIIPVCNRPRTIVEAIRSVLDQTYRDFELIVVDDGSFDTTPRVVQALFEVQADPSTPPLVFLRQPHRGVSAARNLGARRACSEFLAFLDSDDLWTPHKLERQVHWMDAHPHCIACYTDEIWIRNGRRVNPKKKHRKYSGWIFEKCLPLCIISPSSILIRRDVFLDLGGFDESLPVCEDYDLWLRLTCRYQVAFLPEPLIIKRGGHPDQLSKQYWGLDRFRVRALWKLLKQGYLNETQAAHVRAELQRKTRILIEGCRKRGKLRSQQAYMAWLRKISASTY